MLSAQQNYRAMSQHNLLISNGYGRFSKVDDSARYESDGPFPTKEKNRICSLAELLISCVVPSLNESMNLRSLLPQLEKEFSNFGINWEVIIVDDGSTDDTPQLMAERIKKPGFSYVQLSRNFGKEAALTAGLQAACGHAVVIMDADLQHPVSLIPAMIKRWLAGVDNIYAVRKNRDDENLLKRIGSRLFYKLLSTSGHVTVPAHAGDFRLMDRRVVDALMQLPERTRFMKGLYAWVGFSSEPIEYMPHNRQNGRSHFSFSKLMHLALAGLTAFTTWPLRLVSGIGIGIAIPSFAYGAYLSVAYLLHGHNISGWTTIVTLQLFSSGVILLSVGIVGEYLAQVFEEVKGRPLFLVRQHLSAGPFFELSSNK